MKTIEEAFSKYQSESHLTGTDKLTLHSYGAVYSNLLDTRRETELSLLEIGVETGSSLMAWREYLGDSATIQGVDISIHRVKFDQVSVVKADATTAEFADSIPYESLDVIIDDGSHVLADQWRSFFHLACKLKHGGMYVIEDINEFDRFKQMAEPVGFVIHDHRHTGVGDNVIAVFRRS